MKPSEILTTEVIEPRWIVHGMIPHGTKIVLAGEAGAGKSTLCYSLAYRVALGMDFLGHKTNQTRVLYFDEENGDPDFLQYNNWAWAGLGVSKDAADDWLRIEHKYFIKGWKFAMTTALKEHKPGLIIVDTATKAFHIQDENDNAEATRVITDLDRVQQESGCHDATFLVLKHEKQRDDTTHRRSIRGAKAWLSTFDQALYHVIAPGAKRRRDGTRKTVLEPDKLRAFALRFPIGIDPKFTDTDPKGLILNTYSPKSDGAPADE